MQINNIFQKISDPRLQDHIEYSLESILGITLLGGLAGIDSFNGLADFADAHYESLKQYFDLPDKSPSHDTFQRILSSVNPEEFHNSFFEFTERLAVIKQGIISIDGKTIRNSGKNNNPLHIVSAWCNSNSLVLGQKKIFEKSNEITAIPELLKLLDLNDRIITIDAMGCQRAICEQIIKQNGDYLIAVKGNQKTLFEGIKKHFDDKAKLEQDDVSSWVEHSRGHGRIEERKSFAIDNIESLPNHNLWPGLASIGMIISTRNIIKTNKSSSETRYYISSLPADAEKFCKTARSHWGIENKLHWRLDVVFNEDKACIQNENSAENMDIIRKWALNILHKAKTKPDQSIKSLQRKASMSFKHLAAILKGGMGDA